MSKTFEVGTRVAKDVERWNPNEDDSERGEVVGVDPKTQHLLVEVETWGGKTEIRKWNPETTLLESELEAKLSQLEKDYDVVASQVSEKIAAAAALLNEAAAIADKSGVEIQSMYEEVRPLYRALDNAGWSSSSMRC
jgi:hypothetical protein